MKWIQRNTYCPKCDKLFIGSLVREDTMIYKCRECGTECDVLEPVGVSSSTVSKVNQQSRSYKFGRHIDDVKRSKYEYIDKVKKR